jgi:hypothetical protein
LVEVATGVWVMTPDEEFLDYYEDQDAMMAGDTCVECESLIDEDGNCQCEDES